MDIECSEWSALGALVAKPKYLAKVKQLMVEFHTCRSRIANTVFLSYWRTLRELDRLGFKLWRVWDNTFCLFTSRIIPGAKFYRCFNAYYLNVNYLI